MGRKHPCCASKKLRKGLWSPEEDEKLTSHIARFGVSCWSSIPEFAGLQRCGKSCRLRWMNYLRPDLKRGRFSRQEEDLIMALHQALGNSWSQIAARLPGRSDNEIKNFWNARLRKKLRQKGTDDLSTRKTITETEMLQGKEAINGRKDTAKRLFNPFPNLAEDEISTGNAESNSNSSGVQAETTSVHVDHEMLSNSFPQNNVIMEPTSTETVVHDYGSFTMALVNEANLDLLGDYFDAVTHDEFWHGHIFG